MEHVAKTFVLLCFIAGLLAAPAPVGAQSPSVRDQIAQHERNLAAARAGNHSYSEVLELNTLGILYRKSGQMQKALECLNQALPLAEKSGNKIAQAMALATTGRVYTDLGEEDKALEFLNHALPLWQTLGLQEGEASVLDSLGRNYNVLGQRDVALKYLNEAMRIWHEVNDPQNAGLSLREKLRLLREGQAHRVRGLNESPANLRELLGEAGEANTLDNLGRTYSDMGELREALEYFNKALPIWRNANEDGGEALTLTNMGLVYDGLGQFQNSLKFYNQALEIWRRIGNRQGEATTLAALGRMYRDLGQHQSAMDYYFQALPIWRDVGNRRGEAVELSDIGRAYADLGQPRKALEYCEQALPIFRETGSLRGEAMTVNNMGRDHYDLGEAETALALNIQALGLWRQVKDRRGEALALMTIGWAYGALEDKEKSLAATLAALSLTKASGDTEIEGAIETALMMGFRKDNHVEEAIFFGLEAVNAYQKIRKNISELDKDLQAGFAQSKSGTYRALAELLVETGRLGEAEQILDMLKEQELKDIIPGDAPDSTGKIQPLKFTAAQLKVESAMPALEKQAVNLIELSVQAAALQSKASPAADDEAQLKGLNATIEQERSKMLALFTDTIDAELEQKPGTDETEADAAQSYLQSTLTKLGPRVMGIRLLLGQDHAYAIVVTPDKRKKFVLQATPAELREKIFAALQALRQQTADPKPQLAQLYSMVVVPLEGALKSLEMLPAAEGRAPTLLWSLDDALRYLPMAALYDGQRFLVERFNNVLFTPESYGHMTDLPLLNGPKPSALAAGLSKGYGGLSALPGVPTELDSVAHDPTLPESHGPMDGTVLSNDRFTLAALQSELGGQGFSVVHIASHFVVETGSGQQPFLMLGGKDAGEQDGYEWNLSDMENSTITFHGTRLLTLSACSTGKDYKSRNGLEMDSLGMIAQQKDAEAVLATLWDVNDASTSQFMRDFYKRWVNNPAEGKAEALRQVQLSFLRRSSEPSNAAESRGVEAVQDLPPTVRAAGYSHPFYWAPFVLIGNFQ